MHGGGLGYGADTMADLCEAVIVAEADAREAPLAALAAKAKADGCKCLTPDVLSKLSEVMEDGNKKKVRPACHHQNPPERCSHLLAPTRLPDGPQQHHHSNEGTGGVEHAQFNARAGAVACFKTLAETVGASSTPFLVSVLPALLKLYGDKEKSVRTAAEEAAPVLISALPAYATKVCALLSALCPPPAALTSPHTLSLTHTHTACTRQSHSLSHTHSLSADAPSLAQSLRMGCACMCRQVMVPQLLQSMDSSNKSATVQAALALLQQAATKAPMQVAQCLPEIVPVVSGPMTDMVASVAKQVRFTWNTIDSCAPPWRWPHSPLRRIETNPVGVSRMQATLTHTSQWLLCLC